MGELASNLFKALVKMSAIFSAIVGFVIMMTVIISGVGVFLNKSVIEDLLTMVQLWAPFNLYPIILWLSTTITMYITYRFAIYSYTAIKSITDS